jgi:hypothetical protein
MEFVLVLLVLLAVVLVVSGPLRRGRAEELDVDAAREELEAERDAKYREIRDAELDRRMGKLSDDDWRAVDRALRAEAVAILRKLDELPESGAAHEPAEQAEPPKPAEPARPRDAA